MAFPVVAATASYTGAAATSHAVNLPAGISAGNLLVIVAGHDGTPTLTDGTAEYTPGVDKRAFNTQGRIVVFYKTADGGEGATKTLTLSASEELCARAFRITGHHASTAPEFSAGNDGGGASTSPDPDNLALGGWGAEDTLWFVAMENDSSPTISAYPGSYTDGANDRSGSLMGIGTARRELNAASENPGTFTISGSQEWAAVTFAVRPAAAAAATVRQLASAGVGT
jgi:hypothetical protein